MKNEDEVEEITNTTEKQRSTLETSHRFGIPAGMLVGPGSIEASESRGQAELVNSSLLPTNGSEHAIWERWGVKFGAPVPGDDLFRNATLPAGWKKSASEHAMHSSLLDDKGRKRANIFYKGAFYDRRADVSPGRRYRASYEPEGGWKNPKERDYQKQLDVAIVQDSDEVEIWRSDVAFARETQEQATARAAAERAVFEETCAGLRAQIEATADAEEKCQYGSALADLIRSTYITDRPKPGMDLAQAAAVAWLDEHYPEWQDLAAYWD